MKEEPFVLEMVRASMGPCAKGGVHQLVYQERSKPGGFKTYLVACQACSQTWSVTDYPEITEPDSVRVRLRRLLRTWLSR